MAKRHVEEYYNKIAEQYKEMSDNIKELEERLSDNMSSYDVIENMKKIVEPVKENYMTLSWIMFLLNMPNNKKKVTIIKIFCVIRNFGVPLHVFA